MQVSPEIPPPPPPPGAALRVGTLFSITGGLSVFGEKNRQGVTMAFDEINAEGGVNGASVEVFQQNDDTRPDTARTAAEALVAEGVDSILGATGSGQCATVLEVARANRVFEISGSCTSPRFTNTTLTGGWFARTVPSDALQGVVAAAYARTNLSFLRAGVVGINNAYGVALAQTFADNFVRFGGTITSESPRIITEVQMGATDYSADIAAVVEVNPAPQVVYIAAYPPDGILWMQNWEAGRGGNPAWNGITWLFSDGVFDHAGFLDPLGMQYDITGYRGTAPGAYAGLTGPNYAAWSASYNAKWGEAPGLFDDTWYDAAYLVALAAEQAGTSSGTAIRDNIRAVANPPGTKIFPGEWTKAVGELAAGRDIDYEGASGSVNIDASGDPPGTYIIWGVDANEQWRIDDVFPEPLVQALLPAPPVRIAVPRDP